MPSTTSKSASQDFSIQSSIIPNTQSYKNMPFTNTSGFTTPQTQIHQNQNVFANFPGRSFYPHQIDSIFSSPIPRSYIYDTGSQKQNIFNLEGSPPYDDDNEEHFQEHEHNIKFIEKLVCDDEIDFKSNDEQSNTSM